jgi:hypothetical protein
MSVTNDNFNVLVQCLSSIHIEANSHYENGLKLGIDIHVKDEVVLDRLLDGTPIVELENRMVVFVTDGLASSLVSSKIIHHLRLHSIRVLPFVVDAIYSFYVDYLACQTYSHSTSIKKSDGLNSYETPIQSFFQFFAEGVGDLEQVAWTEPYVDSSGLGTMVTASKACYSDEKLLAVAAIDITLTSMDQMEPNRTAYLALLQQRNMRMKKVVPLYESSSALVRLRHSRGVANCDYCKKDCTAMSTATIIVALAVAISGIALLLIVIAGWTAIQLLNRYNTRWFHALIETVGTPVNNQNKKKKKHKDVEDTVSTHSANYS